MTTGRVSEIVSMPYTKEDEAARIRSDAYKEQRRLYRQTKQYKAKYCSEEAKLKRRLREQTPEFKARRNAYLASRRSTEKPKEAGKTGPIFVELVRLNKDLDEFVWDMIRV